MRAFPPFVLWSSTRQFLQDRTASVLPLFAIMVVLIIVAAGAAVDISRVVNAREKLSYALDAAALSVAAELSTSVMTDEQIKEALTETFKANLGDAEFLDAAIDNITFTVNSDTGLISVSTSASLENYFVDIGGYTKKIVGPKTFAFSANTQVTYSRFDVELALVVDVTGSMRNDMDTLREASKGLVDILIPDGTSEDDSKVKISLVPYSEGVNLGTYASKVKGGNHGYSDGNTCVTERQDYDDGKELYEVKYTDASFDYYDETDPPPPDVFYGGGSKNRCPRDSEMLPLTAKRQALIDAIEDLDDGGSTAGQTGITWGWNSLSPNYNDVWPQDSVGAPYTDEDVLKFAVIMTDGDNNMHYEFVKDEQQCEWKKVKGVWKEVCETVVIEKWRPDGDSGYGGESSVASRAMCEAMKTAGIEIFGVYFGSNNNSTGAKNMKSCASDGNYYQATNSAKLISAFSNIAKKIQQIYVSR